MFPRGFELSEEDWMFSDVLDIEEIRTADSVAEANDLLREGWDLIGFHPAPAAGPQGAHKSATIFVMARLEEYEDDLDDLDDVGLEEFEPIPS